MKRLAIYILGVMFPLSSMAQDVDVQDISLLSGCSTINPVVIDSTLYFASNAKSSVAVSYFDENDDRLYQLYQVKLKNKKPSGRVSVAMKRSNRPYNQAAITFDSDKKIHVTQNTQDLSTIKGSPLAIFDYSSLTDVTDGVMSDVKVKFSNAAYPSYSSDGNFMVFVSDVPGGKGAADLYYCVKSNGRWSSPKNMGDVVNTKGTETTPFIHPSGKIFFASNGRADSKKLDIYYTYSTKDGFSEPVRFDVKINSMGDDYGIYYSDDEEWGYFTSNRRGKDAIFYFEQRFPSFEDESEMQEENYCYTFFEESAENYDPEEFSFKWAISDGKSYSGLEVDHCFDGPGDYSIALSVLDKTTKEELFTIAEYSMELRKPEQVNIHVPENIKAGQKVVFTADADNISKFTPKAYFWDFGNGTKVKGKSGTVTFKKKGTYKVRCGTISDEDASDRLCTWVEVTVE